MSKFNVGDEVYITTNDLWGHQIFTGIIIRVSWLGYTIRYESKHKDLKDRTWMTTNDIAWRFKWRVWRNG